MQARNIDVKVTLASLASALTITGSTVLNDEKVTLDVSVDSPQALLGNGRASIKFALATKHVNITYDGGAQQKPVPGLDGSFDLDMPSVGALAAWLGQPLDRSQPDPGPLAVHAVLTADGAKVTLEEMTIRGEALDATASGSFDGSGEVAKIVLNLESGVLDIDRYLPPPSDTPRQTAGMSAEHDKPGDALAAIPDTAFDLTGLHQTEADINVAIGGIKAKGFEIGRIALATTLKGGVLQVTLSELGLYGGNVQGTVELDGATDVLSVAVKLAVAGIDVGALATAATGETPVAGILSTTVEATGKGANPRALVESLAGNVAVDLGGVDVKDAAVPISAVTLAIDLPGIESPPSVVGSIVYNSERVAFDVTLDPLSTVLAGETFALTAAVASKHINLAYDGAVQQQPVPGLDGTFDLDVPSVGKLAAWLGQPLDGSQPDPGPLKVHAALAADGAMVVLEQATIQGEALDATMSGSFDGSGEVAKIVLKLESGVLDIDRYLPPPTGQPAAATAEPAAAPTSADDALAAIPDEPFDLAPLRQTEADITVAIGGVKAMGYEIGRIALATTLKGGVLDLDLSELGLYGGNVTATVKLDGATDVLGVAVNLAVDAVDLGALAEAAMGGAAPVAGILSSTVEATGMGANPRALVESLASKFTVDLGGIDVQDAEVPISEVMLAVDLPGLESQPSISGAVVYNSERINLDVTLDPLVKVLGGERFALDAKIASALVTLAYVGAVQQQPVPGLDGTFDLDVPSVGKLAAWLGQPLDESQPDPGPLNVHAVLAADGDKVALNEATIKGKALMVNAKGSFDGSGAVAQFAADVVIELADLNAYLPPEEEGGEAAEAAEAEAAPAGEKAEGWSEEPIDFSALSLANGEAKVTIGKILYKELTIENGVISVTMLNGVLTAAIDGLAMAGGTVDTKVTVDASQPMAAVAYQAAIVNMQALPLLRTFAGTDRLSGTANLKANGQAVGSNQKQFVETLNGGGGFAFLEGAIHGINIAEAIRSLGSLGFGDEGPPQKTDFAEISGSFTIVDGLLENRDFQMLAPLLRVTGAGLVPMPPRTVNYNAELKLVASTEGQGGDAALAGLPIPVAITGPWSDPSYGVDWGSLLGAAALDPARLAAMPDDMLEAATGFGIDLPGLGGGDSGIGGLLDSVIGGSGDSSGDSGGLGGLLDSVIGGGSQDTTAEEPAAEEEAPLEGLGNALDSLFGN